MTDEDEEKKAKAATIADLRRKARGTLVLGCILFILGFVGWFVDRPSWYQPLLELEDACVYSIKKDSACEPSYGLQSARTALEAADKHLHYWAAERTRIAEECVDSIRRQCELQARLGNPSSPGFSDARKLLNEERSAFAALADREARLHVAGYSWLIRIVFVLLDVLIGWLSISLLLWSGRLIVEKHGPKIVKSFWPVWRVFVAVGAGTTLLTVLIGGIYVEHKTSIGADSYAVSPATWIFSVITISGSAVMLTSPMALFWCLGNPKYVPDDKEIEVFSPDGECGVGRYVSFLQMWAIAAFAIGTVPAILWLRYISAGAALSTGYLLPVIVGEALLTYQVGRLIYNAAKLRLNYRIAIAKLGNTLAEVEAKKPAPDPTIAFIGENWWKVPATLGAILFTLWQVFEWTGVSKVIVAATGG